jgi:hypothetical protein
MPALRRFLTAETEVVYPSAAFRELNIGLL